VNTMSIYAIKRDGFKYQELDLNVNDFIDDFPEEYSYRQAHDFSIENIAMANFWKPVRTGFSRIEGQDNLIPDLTPWIRATILFSPKAYRLLGDTMSPYGEFLPILIENGDTWDEYQIFNCLTMVDAIEEKSSDSSIAFDPSSVGDELVFKTAYNSCLDLFCGPRLKSAIEDFGLNGVIFDTQLSSLCK